ncbi:MAG: T9SS type A sorting domain-containing protein [Paludibacteraceae bacterium]|nr:T9SS type A sorting domain-containing protein [Paludibacteraceae bacterium]
MKFNLQLLLTSLLLGLVSFIQAQTITLKYGTTAVTTYETVSIYQTGKEITSSSTGSTGVATFSLAAGSYTYVTSTNQTGTITNTSSVTLSHNKLVVKYVNASSVALSGYTVYIYENGNQVASETTASDGTATFYLKPSANYAYAVEGNTGAVNLTSDASITVTASATVALYAYAHYGDIPVEDNFYLYNYGNLDNYISSTYTYSTNGEAKFIVSPGKYWIKNKFDIFTSVDVPSTGKAIYLDYKKVRFNTTNGSTANIVKDITVNRASSYNSIKKETDGKGYADFYLLPGDYKYTHLGNTTSFKVANDTSINISTNAVIVSLKNKATQAIYAYQAFEIGTTDGNYQTYKTDASGNCTISLPSGSYRFTMDETGFYDFTVSSSATSIAPSLYEFQLNTTGGSSQLTAKSNISILSSNKSNSSNYYIGKKTIMLEGDYNYYLTSNYYGRYVPFTLNSNLSLTIGLYDINVTVADNSGNPVSGESISLKQNESVICSGTTDSNGKLSLQLLEPGTYSVIESSSYLANACTISNNNVSTNFKVPNFITLNVTKNGKTFSGSITLTKDFTDYQSCSITNGVGKARFTAGNQYYAAMNTYCSFTAADNMNLDFVQVKTKASGKGLAFPYDNGISPNYYLKGNAINLAGVPMKGYECTKWVINGQEVASDMVDYTVSDTTTAIAVFSATNSSLKSATAANEITIFPNPATDQITLSEEVNGTVSIYDTTGKLVRSSYLLGNKLNVSALQSGQYVLYIESKGESYQGIFIKK